MLNLCFFLIHTHTLYIVWQSLQAFPLFSWAEGKIQSLQALFPLLLLQLLVKHPFRQLVVPASDEDIVSVTVVICSNSVHVFNLKFQIVNRKYF